MYDAILPSERCHRVEATSGTFHLSKLWARYKLVRVEAEPAGTDRQIVCRSCGVSLVGRGGNFVLKYFLVGRPRRQAKRQGRGQLGETGTPEQR
jgi:hypothetical protein